jgi:hypothetical protein
MLSAPRASPLFGAVGLDRQSHSVSNSIIFAPIDFAKARASRSSSAGSRTSAGEVPAAEALACSSSRCHASWISAMMVVAARQLVGQALLTGRKICMVKVGATKPRGIKYVTEFGRWPKDKGFDDVQKTRRTCSMCVATHWSEIQAAMKTLSAARRSEMNDCTNVWRWFRSRDKQAKSSQKYLKF